LEERRKLVNKSSIPITRDHGDVGRSRRFNRAHFKCASSQRLIARASRLARALGRPTLSLRMPDQKTELPSKPQIGLVWVVFRWVSRTYEGPTTGIHQPLTTRPSFLSSSLASSAPGFQAVALTSSDSAAGWLPDLSPWPPPPNARWKNRFPRHAASCVLGEQSAGAKQCLLRHACSTFIPQSGRPVNTKFVFISPLSSTTCSEEFAHFSFLTLNRVKNFFCICP
jgi:hypothetical protein